MKAVLARSALAVALSASAIVLAACDAGRVSDPLSAASGDALRVTRIDVSPDSSFIAVGDMIRLRATAYDQHGNPMNGREVQWRASQLGRVKVTADGIIEALGEGEDSVSAVVDGQAAVALFKVRGPRVKAVYVNLSPRTIAVGEISQASAELRLANGNLVSGNVFWTSSNEAVATISESGRIVGRNPGTTVITGMSEGERDTEVLTVVAGAGEPQIASVSVTAPTSLVYVGRKVRVTAVVRDDQGNVLPEAQAAWSSSDPSVATVTADGEVAGQGPGTASIVAVSGGESGQTAMSVSIAPVNAVAVSVAPVSIEVGQTALATVQLYDSDGELLTGRDVAFSSSNPGVAAVNSLGQVSGLAAGSVTIMATSEGRTGVGPLSVTAPAPKPVNSVSVVVSSASLSVGQTTQAVATLRDDAGQILSGRAIVWSSTNPAAATVSSSGLVSAVGAGTATIRATSEGKTGGTTVQVLSQVLLTAVMLSPESASLSGGASQQFNAVGVYSDGSSAAIAVGYSATGGSVTAGGLYTAGSTGGTYRVIATNSASGFADTAVVTISVASSPPPTPPWNPPADFATCGNEPAGFRSQVDIGFNVLPTFAPTNPGLHSSEGTITWNPIEQMSIVSDANAPTPGGKYLSMRFPGGMPGGAAPEKFGVARVAGSKNGAFFESNVGQIYVCYFVRYSANWTNNGNVGTKLFFLKTGIYDGGDGYINHFLACGAANLSNPRGSDIMQCGTFMQSAGLERADFIKASNPTLNDGNWHKMEHLWIAGTPGVANSIVREWTDGVLTANATDVKMFHAWQVPQWAYMMFDPTYGGGLNPVPYDMYLMLDRLYVSVK